MTTPSQYIPGVCNIGPTEIRMRKAVGWIGLAATVLFWFLFGYVGLGAPWFLVLFFPAAMSATGFIQGFSHFCAGFGMRGLFNFGPQVGKTDSVSQAEYRAKDKKKAQSIFLYSVLIGLVVAIVAFFLK